MRPDLRALATRQGGLVTRRQAVLAGYSERELRTRTAVGGRWVVVRRGVYVERELWESLERHEGQWLLRDRAADLTMTRLHVLSHDSAARVHGLPLLRPRLPLVHVTRPGVTGSRTEGGVKHHLSRLEPDPVECDGTRVTGLARTALDVAREHGLAAGVVTADAVRRLGVEPEDFGARLRVMRCWPGITTARAAAELSDPGAETPGESLMRLLIRELGLGPLLRTQFPVVVEGRTYFTDLIVGCHVFEFDGRQKYLRPHAGGIAERPIEDILWDERERQRLVCSVGLGMSRVIWDDFWGPARARAKDRLRREYAVTAARFGDVLPAELMQTAQRLTRQLPSQRRHSA